MPAIILPTTTNCMDDSSNKTRLLLFKDTAKEPRSIFTRSSGKLDPVVEDLPQRQQCRQQQIEVDDEEKLVCDLARYSSLNVKDQQSPMEYSLPAITSGHSLTESPAADAIFLGRTHIALLTLLRQLSTVTRRAGAIFQLLSTDVERIYEQSRALRSRLDSLQAQSDPLLRVKGPKPGTSGLVRYTGVKNHFRSWAKEDVEDKGRRCRLFTPLTRTPVIVFLYEQADVDPSKKRPSRSTASVEHCATQTEDDNVVLPTNETKEQSTIGEVIFVQDNHDDERRRTECHFNQSSNRNLERHNPSTESAGFYGHSVSGSHCNGDVTTENGDISTSSGRKYTLESTTTTTTSSEKREQASVSNCGTASVAVHTVTCGFNSPYGGLVPTNWTDKENRIRPAGRHCRTRRNTVAGFEMGEKGTSRGKNSQDKDGYDLSERVVTTTGDSLVNEVVYEFAPFHRRKARKLLNPGIFSSLRRMKKSTPLANSTPSKVTLKDDVQAQHDSSMKSESMIRTPETPERTSKSGSNSAINNLKQLFRRSASLRRSKRGKDDPDTSFKDSSPAYSPCKAKDGFPLTPCNFPRNYAYKPKSSIPISTTSQVIHLAANLRDCPQNNAGQTEQRFSKISSSSSRDSAYSSCKKLRPPSSNSLMSLDFTESKLNGWYRQGYQLEYPEECVRENGTQRPRNDDVSKEQENGKHSKLPTIQNPSRDTSNSSPYSDASSFVDSNYSCDPEGYFTTMHRDCGLRTNRLLKRPNNSGRSSDVSANSSLITVTDQPIVGSDLERRIIGAGEKGSWNGGHGTDCSLTASNGKFTCSVPSTDTAFIGTVQPSHTPVDHSLPPSGTGLRGSSTPTGPYGSLVPIPGPSNGPVNGPSSGPVNGPFNGPIIGPVSGPVNGPFNGPINDPSNGPATGSFIDSVCTAPIDNSPFNGPTLSPPMSASSEAEVKFDLWLMSKFYAEQRMERFREQLKQDEVQIVDHPFGNVNHDQGRRNWTHFSLPRSRKVKCEVKKGIVANYLRSLDTPDNDRPVDYSSTLPKKTVRFCE